MFSEAKYLIPLLGILAFVAMQVLGYNGLYSQDSYEYVRYSDAWIHFFQTGVHPGDYYWPVNYPVIGALLAYPFSLAADTVMPLISLLAICFSCGMVLRMLKWLYPDKKGALIWVVLALFLVPYGFRLGVSSMSDQLGAMFCIASFYFTVKVNHTQNFYHLIWVAFFAGMAIMTRYIAGLVLAPLALYWVYSLIKSKKWIPVILAIPALLIPLIPHLWLRLESTANISDHAALTRWTPMHLFTRHFESDLGSFDYLVPNIMYLGELFLHPGFLFFGILLLPFYRQIFKQKENFLFAASILVFLVFIGGIDTQNSRYFVLVIPLVTLLLFPAFHRGFSILKEKQPTLAHLLIPALLVGQLGLCAHAFNKSYVSSKSQETLANHFSALEQERVYCYGASMMMGHFNKENEFITLHAIDSNVFVPGDYYLHHSSWEEHAQLKNLYHVSLYRKLLDEGKFTEVKQLNDGWLLYRYHELP